MPLPDVEPRGIRDCRAVGSGAMHRGPPVAGVPLGDGVRGNQIQSLSVGVKVPKPLRPFGGECVERAHLPGAMVQSAVGTESKRRGQAAGFFEEFLSSPEDFGERTSGLWPIGFI